MAPIDIVIDLIKQYKERGMLRPDMTDVDVDNLKKENLNRKKADIEEYKARALAEIEAKIKDKMAEL